MKISVQHPNITIETRRNVLVTYSKPIGMIQPTWAAVVTLAEKQHPTEDY